MIKLDFLLNFFLHPLPLFVAFHKYSWYYVPILVLDFFCLNIHDFLNYVGNIFILQISLTVNETVYKCPGS